MPGSSATVLARVRSHYLHHASKEGTGVGTGAGGGGRGAGGRGRGNQAAVAATQHISHVEGTFRSGFTFGTQADAVLVEDRRYTP